MAVKGSAKIKGAVRREDTILRLGGIGDDFHMTWAADDTMFTSACDGNGWYDPPKAWFNSRVWQILGGPEDARFVGVEGYPDLINSFDGSWNTTRYYGFGLLAVDGVLYQFLSTPSVPFFEPNPRFIGIKLIYSEDNGATWRNQDGSPAAFEAWEDRSAENMLFFEEPGEAFSQLSVLQMGKDYGANEDGYVYVYGPNGNVEGTMNELVMFRVPKDQMLNRGAYEYFAGLRSDGEADWTSDVSARVPTVTNPSGWVNKTLHPWAWLPTVVYNEALGAYIMVNSATGCSSDGNWFRKPSYLGMWSAPNPWGPWTQFHEELAWLPGGDRKARCYSPTIGPRWIAEDGMSFWLTFGDFQNTVSEDADVLEEMTKLNDLPEFRQFTESFAGLLPNYGFNVQRVDLDVELLGR